MRIGTFSVIATPFLLSPFKGKDNIFLDIHMLCYFMVERMVIRLSSISSTEGIS